MTSEPETVLWQKSEDCCGERHIFLGTVNDYFYPEDKESGKESIAIDTIEKQTIEFNADSIQKIEAVQ